MLGDGNAVRSGDFGHGDMVAGSRLQIDMVRADPGGERQLQLLALAMRSGVR
jgi:hypothetical protein